MIVYHVGDIDITYGWCRKYVFGSYGSSQDTLKEADALVKARWAFAFVSNSSHSGNQDFPADVMQGGGWEPVVWKESSHMQKYSIQLYRKEFPERSNTGGTNHIGTAVEIDNSRWLGCSVFPKEVVAKAFPKEDFPNCKCPAKGKRLNSHVNDNLCNTGLKFLVCTRPLSKELLAYFEVDDFWQRIAMTADTQVWAWGYKGLADHTKCLY